MYTSPRWGRDLGRRLVEEDGLDPALLEDGRETGAAQEGRVVRGRVPPARRVAEDGLAACLLHGPERGPDHGRVGRDRLSGLAAREQVRLDQHAVAGPHERGDAAERREDRREGGFDPLRVVVRAPGDRDAPAHPNLRTAERSGRTSRRQTPSEKTRTVPPLSETITETTGMRRVTAAAARCRPETARERDRLRVDIEVPAGRDHRARDVDHEHPVELGELLDRLPVPAVHDRGDLGRVAEVRVQDELVRDREDRVPVADDERGPERPALAPLAPNLEGEPEGGGHHPARDEGLELLEVEAGPDLVEPERDQAVEKDPDHDTGLVGGERERGRRGPEPLEEDGPELAGGLRGDRGGPDVRGPHDRDRGVADLRVHERDHGDGPEVSGQPEAGREHDLVPAHRNCRTSAGISEGRDATATPMASSARILERASPSPPSTIAPAWPIRLSGGAETPAM